MFPLWYLLVLFHQVETSGTFKCRSLFWRNNPRGVYMSLQYPISTDIYSTIIFWYLLLYMIPCPPKKNTWLLLSGKKNTCINSSECLHIPSLGKKELMTAQWHLPTSPWTYVTLQGTKICHLGKKEPYLLKHTVDGQNPANQFVW